MPSSPQNSSGRSGLFYILLSALGVLWLLLQFRAPNKDAREVVHPQDTPEPEAESSNARLGGKLMVHSPTNSEEPKKGGKRETPFWEKVAVFIALALLLVNWYQGCQTRKSADAATIAANAAKNSADTAINDHYWTTQDRRPWIWVKPPRGLQIKVGKPMSATVEVFNYGTSPGLARTIIHIEAGPRVIEKFRDECKNNRDTAYLIPDDKTTFTAVIAPQEGVTDFPVESFPSIVSREDYDKITNGIAAGTLDVVIYGRIWSSDVKRPWQDRFNSIFCFHLLRNRTIGACPNEEHAYTNFMSPAKPPPFLQ
jgi:hypothetical protein